MFVSLLFTILRFAQLVSPMELLSNGVLNPNIVPKKPCNASRVSYPCSSDDELNLSTCTFPIKSHHYWSMVKFEPMVEKFQSKSRKANETFWLDLFEKFAKNKFSCLQFKVHYEILQNTGLVELKITVFCDSRKRHTLQLHVDSEGKAATTTINVNDQSHILNGNCSNIADLLFEIQINTYLKILSNNSAGEAVLLSYKKWNRGKEVCNCTIFKEFEQRLKLCGPPAKRSGRRIFIILFVLVGTGLMIAASIAIFSCIQRQIQ